MKKKHNPFGSFRELSADVNYIDYGGKWVRHVAGRVYHVIEALNWEDTVGSREAAEIGAKYNIALKEVDLDNIPDNVLQSVLEFIGWKDWGEGEPEDLVLVEGCCSYGAYAPCHDANGNNWWALFRDARRLSREMDDDDRREAVLDRPVNKIGSTAREYMAGDIASAIVRGVQTGNEAAILLGKTYQHCGYNTLGGRLPREEVVAIEDALEKEGECL